MSRMPVFAQSIRQRVEIADAVGELLQAGAALVDELGDRRVLVQRRHQLHLGASLGSAAHGQHRFANALIVVDLFVEHDHAEVVVIPLDRDVEVGYRDADVVDGCHQGAREHGTRTNMLGRHLVTVTFTGMFT